MKTIKKKGWVVLSKKGNVIEDTNFQYSVYTTKRNALFFCIQEKGQVVVRVLITLTNLKK